jgi:uncharacterized protein (DUF1778 family)
MARRLEMYGGLPYSGAMRTATKPSARRKYKTERLELRVTPSVRRVIERATAMSGLAPGDLAYEGARRVLEDHKHWVLGGADREAFLQAVDNPPRPTRRLIAALRRHGNVRS